MGKAKQALMNYNKSLKFANITKNLQETARVNNNIGSLYLTKGEVKKALKYFENYVSISKKIDYSKGIAIGSLNIALSYVDLEKYEKAKGYLDKVKKYAKKLNMAVLLIEYYLVYSKLLFQESNEGFFDEAIRLLEKGNELCEKIRSHSYAAKCLNQMGDFYYDAKEHDYEKALICYCNALIHVEKIKGDGSELKEKIGDWYKKFKNKVKLDETSLECIKKSKHPF